VGAPTLPASTTEIDSFVKAIQGIKAVILAEIMAIWKREIGSGKGSLKGAIKGHAARREGAKPAGALPGSAGRVRTARNG
jgi:hypothetical protein